MSYETKAGTAVTGTRTGAAAALARALWLAVLAVVMFPAFAAAPAPAPASPRLATLTIEMWPEFDRPAALVILNGELPADMPLPATISLRLPAASGGPSAVAFASAPGAQLFNLKHEVVKGDKYATVKFSLPQRYFHVEFYDPIDTSAAARAYTYTWPGDLGVDRLNVVLQEPAAASDVSVRPSLGPASAGALGLAYRKLEFGAYKAGTPLPIAVRYTKNDPGTSSEILKLDAPAANAPASARPAPAGVAPAWVPLVISAGVTAGLALALLAWAWRRHRGAARSRAHAGKFCVRCGNVLLSENRYCGACGARVGKP